MKRKPSDDGNTGRGGWRNRPADLPESTILRAVLLAIGHDPRWRVWRANAGVGITPDGGRVIRFGLPGQADISGVLRGGKRLEIEVKTARGVQSDRQRAFASMIQAFGGVYLLVRSAEDARKQLDALNIPLV